MHQVRYAQDEIVWGEVNPAAQKIEVHVLPPVIQDVASTARCPCTKPGSSDDLM